MCSCIFRMAKLMTYAPFFNLGRLFLENTPLNPFIPSK